MRSLIYPRGNPFHFFKFIVNSKNAGESKTRLTAILNDIQNQYGAYSDNKHQLEVVIAANHTDPEKTDLINCYSGNADPVNQLKALITDLQCAEMRNLCPYCLICFPNTFDHYLAKEDYPEFAVNAINLIPCCSTCNSKKGQYLIVDGRRKIINFYFDNLITEKYLNVDFSYTNDKGVASYSLQQYEGMNDDLFALISAHYVRLDLLSKYKKNSEPVFSEARTSIQTHYPNASVIKIKNYLINESQRLSNNVHVNYWKAVLYEAISENNAFINSCRI